MTSGGIGSAMTLEKVIARYGVNNTISLFADTKIEDPDLHRFLYELHQKLEIKMTLISYGKDPFDLFDERNFIANSRVDVCSKYLKRDLMDRWISARFKPDKCSMYIGIDHSEVHRIERLAPAKLPWRYYAPLAEDGLWLTPEMKIEWCERLDIKPPLLYTLGFPHNNCGGFCVKAGLGQFKMLYEHFPERYLEHERRERDLIARKPNLKPFLRKVTKGVTRYLTMQQYREEFLMPTSPGELTIDDKIDLGGCGCAI